ncbi:MAG: hypothetical protein AAGC64_13570, partial [Bacteroidota bacterium]
KHSIEWFITPEKLYAPTDRIPGYTNPRDLIIKIINRYENKCLTKRHWYLFKNIATSVFLSIQYN